MEHMGDIPLLLNRVTYEFWLVRYLMGSQRADRHIAQCKFEVRKHEMRSYDYIKRTIARL